MARLKVDVENGSDIELHYEDYGNGKPVVLIHGWPLTSRSWELQVPALIDAGHRVVAYDRRGFGASSQPWEGYDYDTLTRDLHALIEHLDLREVTLVGFSMGGGEVARYVGRHGRERVARAVFASSATPFLHKSDRNPDGRFDEAGIEQMLDGVQGDRVGFIDQFLENFFSAGDRRNLVSEPTRRYHLHMAEFASPRATVGCVKAFSFTDFRGDLERFDLPTLVIHGDSDAILPFEVSGKRTHALVSGSELALIENAGHGLNATHPQEFNSALVGFLSQ